jgi:hypothetical protein
MKSSTSMLGSGLQAAAKADASIVLKEHLSLQLYIS